MGLISSARNLALSAGQFVRRTGDVMWGHLIPGATNTYDLGSTASRWRDVWALGVVRGSIVRGSEVNATTFNVNSAGTVFWTSRARIYSPTDGLIQTSNDANTQSSAILQCREVDSTGGNLTDKESGKVCTNNGAGGVVNFNLPPARDGLFYAFVCETAAPFSLQAVANGTETIRDGGGVSSAGGTATVGAIGDAFTLYGSTGVGWYVISQNGTAPTLA